MANAPRGGNPHVKFHRRRDGLAVDNDGRSASGQKVKLKIKVTPPEELASYRQPLILALVAVFGLVAAGVYAIGSRPDPHFVAAVELVQDYESRRTERARNYGSPVYEKALRELALVSKESISFDEAEELSATIVDRREAFFVRLREADRGHRERRKKSVEKNALFAARRAQSRMNPRVEYPECDE